MSLFRKYDYGRWDANQTESGYTSGSQLDSIAQQARLTPSLLGGTTVT
jgi:hypothetical protein